MIVVGEYYQLQSHEEKQSNWIFNSELLTDIGNGKAVVAKDNSGTEDISDISDAIKYLQDNLNEYDEDGRRIQRVAAAKKGWSFLSRPTELETSLLNSEYSKSHDEVDRSDVTLKFYNAQDAEITVQGTLDTDCVKTILTISPNHDYELIGGSIRQESSPGVAVRVWVVGGVPELGSAGIKEFIGGVNMCFLSNQEHVQTDGRASKYMKKTTAGIPYNTNQLQFIIRHPAGKKHKLMFTMEYFRA